MSQKTPFFLVFLLNFLFCLFGNHSLVLILFNEDQLKWVFSLMNLKILQGGR